MLSPPQFDELQNAFPDVRNLSPKEKEELASVGMLMKRPAETLLFDTASSCESYLMLLEGRVRVTVQSEEGRRIQLYWLEPGETCVLTTSCLLGKSPYPARGETETDCRAVVIPKASFNSLLATSPGIRSIVFASYGERMASMLGLVQDLAFTRVEQRLAAAILKSEPNVGTTHHTLAVEVGSVREVVSRVLKSFEQRGLVKTSRKQIEVLDHEALRRLAETTESFKGGGTTV